MQKMPMIRTVYTRENPDYADAASGLQLTNRTN